VIIFTGDMQLSLAIGGGKSWRDHMHRSEKEYTLATYVKGFS
jgi:hypothetical protein